MRRARIDRRTTETRVRCRLTIEGRGRYHVRTGIRFLDHMLELVARHGGFDLDIDAKGDLDVDAHHTVEDVGIALGEAVARALGSKRGILVRDKSSAPGCAGCLRITSGVVEHTDRCLEALEEFLAPRTN